MAGRMNVDEVANSAGTGAVSFPFGYSSTGSATLNGVATFANGSATDPSIAWTADNDGSGTGLYRPSANAIGFTTNGIFRMMVDSTGQLGLGVVPAQFLHAEKGQNAATNFQLSNLTSGTAASAALIIGTDGSAAGAILRSYSSTFSTSGYAIPNSLSLAGRNSGGLSLVAEDTVGVIRFYTNGQTSERMRIDASGNVGIGVTPGFTFHAQKSVVTTLSRIYNTSTASGASALDLITGSNVASDFVLRARGNDGSTEALWIGATGNVGIGTTSPGRNLDIKGTTSSLGDALVNLDRTAVANQSGFYLRTGGTTDEWLIRCGGSGTDSDFHIFRFAPGAGDALTIARATGAVTIPVSLTVNGSSTFAGSPVTLGLSDSATFTMQRAGTVGIFNFAADTVGNGASFSFYGTSHATKAKQMEFQGSVFSFFDAATTNLKLRMDLNGNVAIGFAALATSATDGFLYIPTAPGTPTGVPTTFTGRSPIVYNTSKNRLYAYNGAWKDVAKAGAVLLKASVTAAQSIPDTTATVVKFDTAGIDTDAALNTSTFTYTFPVIGKYRITGRVTFARTTESVTDGSMTISINGANTATQSFNKSSVSNDYIVATFESIVSIASTSDTLQIKVAQDNVTNASLPLLTNATGADECVLIVELVGT